MEDTVSCPACGYDNAYFDGVLYTCPTCDLEWCEDDDFAFNEQSFDNDNLYREAYKFLIKKSEPLFSILHGQLYSCKVEGENGDSETTIIPLAFEEGKNRLFVLYRAEQIPAKYPEFLKEVASKNFRTIRNEQDKNGDYPSSYKAEPIMCTTDKDGTLINQFGEHYYNLVLMERG